MKRIYLDHAATTPLALEVFEMMQPFLSSRLGNPSSIHAEGREARVAIDLAREQLASYAGCAPAEVIFTSGGTEANNTAVFGAAGLQERAGHIVTSAIEHPCVLASCRALEEKGWRVTLVEPDTYGRITVETVINAIIPKTVLISIMHANNEVGTINPIHEIAAAANERGIAFHTDAVQTFGKLEFNFENSGIAMMSVSGHKVYGPKGVGALFVRSGKRIAPLLHGGKQERDRRAGTENVAAIAGFGQAVVIAMHQLEEEKQRLRHLADYFASRLMAEFPECVCNGHPEHRLHHIINASFPGWDSLSLVMRMDMEGVAISNGSACSSGSVEPSHVLRAMKLPSERASSAVRFSLGRTTTKEELEATILALRRIVKRKASHRPPEKLSIFA